MHLKRVIPCLDVDGGRVVKGTNFVDVRDAGDPVELAARYDREGADEIVFLDITATHERRETIVDLARRVADEVFVPFTIGGGIRTVQDAQAVLDAGADKVSVNSAAVARPALLDELSRRFGSQSVVVAIDARRRGGAAGPPPGAAGPPDAAAGPVGGRGGVRAAVAGEGTTSPGPWEVVVAGGREATGRDAVAWAVEAVGRGAGEVLLTSMDADGTREGFDLPLTEAVAAAVPVPVIASGGVGRLEHLVDGLRSGADAVLAASIFHYGQHSVQEAKAALVDAGVPVRRVVPVG